MSAKDARNLILALIILIVAIFVLSRWGKGIAGTAAGPVATLTAGLDSVSNLLILGLGLLVIILIPIYLSRRSGEKKYKQQAQAPQSAPKK